ncbi:ABC transporter ATP-binding protein [Gandjariella thermophila]|uniref:ABC transporter ATPase n=1 Tax=Gandjariella thermophila TaxID=1931992 RepID=A0A4D4J6L8_9PSEU|nr:ATP-binding cassette domain-containing protein [Gandjariella thermophila]GDY30156.1 ABC transporter ATPase [Gandjariella thermophila]
MLSVRGLTKVYGGRPVVNQVSFDLQPGTVTAFLGPNGAGKSTTLRMICGLTVPTAGEARIGGRPFTAWRNPCYAVGALLDASATHPGRTGRGQLRMAARLAGLPPRRVDEVLDMVGLTGFANRRIATYSLGLRQRVALAHALLADPPLLLLDEPINGLDPDGIRAIRGLLRMHAARGGTVLLSSHLLSEVDQTADRVLVINGGRIVADGPMDMLTSTTDRCLVRAKDMNQLAEVLRWAGIEVQPRPDGFLLACAGVEQVSDVTFEAGIRLLGLREEQRNLEDVFFQLTEGTPG